MNNLYQLLINCKGDIDKINAILESVNQPGTEFSHEEIANILHITEDESRRLQHVAVIRLRNWYKAESSQLLKYMQEYYDDHVQ